MAARTPTFNLSRTFAYLARAGPGERLDTRQKGFWASLADRDLDGYLVGQVAMRRNTAWERHRDGDELLVMLTGALDVVLDHDDAAEQVIELCAGRSLLVPATVWHRQLVRTPGDLLFITPGPGTDRRGVREHAAARQSPHS